MHPVCMLRSLQYATAGWDPSNLLEILFGWVGDPKNIWGGVAFFHFMVVFGNFI